MKRRKTHIEVISPDSSLVSLSSAVGRGRDIELGDHGLNAERGEGGEGGGKGGLGDEVAGGDVGLEANGETRVGNGGRGLHVLEDGNHASGLGIIGTC